MSALPDDVFSTAGMEFDELVQASDHGCLPSGWIRVDLAWA